MTGMKCHEEENFENLVLADRKLQDQVYESCSFLNCDFSAAYISFCRFIDCTFENCNLSMAKLAGSQFKDTLFRGCKILGVNFSDCTDLLFAVSFEKCLLDYASFAGRKMAGTPFGGSSLKNADFTETDLSSAIFVNCNLENAVFSKTTLRSADLRGATDYSIDPESNIIRKARFSASGIEGLLRKYDINIE